MSALVEDRLIFMGLTYIHEHLSRMITTLRSRWGKSGQVHILTLGLISHKRLDTLLFIQRAHSPYILRRIRLLAQPPPLFHLGILSPWGLLAQRSLFYRTAFRLFQ